MKGSIGTSTVLFVIKERRLSQTERKRLAKVKGKHKIKRDHPFLEQIAERKRQREMTQKLLMNNNIEQGITKQLPKN